MIFGDIVQELTKRKPFIFVIMKFEEGWTFYEKIQEIIQKEFGLVCICADDVLGSGYDLLDKIHLLIERAELVVAIITPPSPNVFYEVGYATAIRKPLLLLAEKDIEIPADLRGRELIHYQTSKDGLEAFYKRFLDNIRIRISSRIALLKDMLESEDPQPIYIVASPKYPDENSKKNRGPYDRRTFGDNLGIVGLLAAFGLIMGEGRNPELVSAQYCEPDLPSQDCNLFLIGSKKVNWISGNMLELLQQNREPNWYLGRKEGSEKGNEEEGDYNVKLYRTVNGVQDTIKGHSRRSKEKGGIVHLEDYGIIVRGPHPEHPNRIVLIMAGMHSLGTGGACIAATRSPIIRQIQNKLPDGIDIADQSRTIWVLVRAVAGKDGLLDEEGVEICEAGVYDPLTKLS